MTIFARRLRRVSTPAEKVFWSRVRNRKFLSYKFNRQYVIRYDHDIASCQFYIVDFYCHARRLIIEIDGGIHDAQLEADLLRESRLIEMGYRVIRFKNEEVLFNWRSVHTRLEEVLK